MSFDPEQPLVPAPLIPSPAPPATNAFVGPFGLRAGWGILLFAIVFVALTLGIGFGSLAATGRLKQVQQQKQRAVAEARQAKATHTQAPIHPMTVDNSLLGEWGQTAAVLLAALGLSFLERRRFAVYGLGLRHLRDILPGALWGLGTMAALVGVLRALHLVVFDARLLHGPAVLGYGAAWLALFFLVGIFEEFLFRGYLQYTLTRGLFGLAQRMAPQHARAAAFWMSALLWSLLFLSAHLGNAGENAVGLAGVFVAGIMLSYALWRTGSLWWAIGFHTTWDWAQSFLFGVPDSGTLSAGRLFATHAMGRPVLSGGVDGPEGSVLGVFAFLLILLAVRLQPQAAQPPLEPESLPQLAGENPVSSIA